MASTTSRIEKRASRAVMDSLGDILAIETQILASLDDWATAVRDHPEAAAMGERMRRVAKSHQETWAGRVLASKQRRSSRASRRFGTDATPASAQETIRRVTEVAAEAVLECERAYQTARLAGEAD